MSSGVPIQENVLDVFKQFKMQKQHRFFTLKIEDKPGDKPGDKSGDKPCVVYEAGSMKSEDTDGQDPLTPLLKLLKDNKPRYCFLDHPVEQKITRTVIDALFFIQFIPDDCKVKERMLYASTAATVKTMAGPSCTVIQLNTLSDLDTKFLQERYEK